MIDRPIEIELGADLVRSQTVQFVAHSTAA
jgi:hypothetical protein